MRKIVLTIAVMGLIACGGGSYSPTQSMPTAPTATPAASSPTTNWTVTHRFVSVTGADNCWVRLQRGRLTGVVFPNLEMSVTRSGGAITIESPWFLTYSGTISGQEFMTRQADPLQGSATTDCGGGTVIFQKPGVSNLSGRFATDDQAMSGTESNVYPLNTGETVTYTWDWQATRRN